MDTDQELLERYQATGEERALEELYGRHFGAVYQVALGLLHRPPDARDVAQNVFRS